MVGAAGYVRSAFSSARQTDGDLLWARRNGDFAIRDCRRQGLGMPDDIWVVGFSDITPARLFEPPLSTVKHH